MRADGSSKTPLIGILCREQGTSPRGLVQHEVLPGNSTNPETFEFPVRYCRARGANIHTILENPSQDILQSMIGEARRMAEQGIRAITTSCGYNAVFQHELSDSVRVPVFTSSLMQIPLVHNMPGETAISRRYHCKENSYYRKTPEQCWNKRSAFDSYCRSGRMRAME